MEQLLNAGGKDGCPFYFVTLTNLNRMKRLVAIMGLVLAPIYLLNFTFGIWELPDNLPIIGNLDELAAAVWLMASLKHFGIDITDFLLSPRRLHKSKKE